MMSSLRISSAICKVFWAGWESDTLSLQRKGWEISAEQDIASMRFRIAIRNVNYRIYGISKLIPYEEFREVYVGDNPRYQGMTPPIHIQYMASRMEINIMDNDMDKFHPIDALPSVVINKKRKSLEDFMMFRPIAKSNEIIVADYEVGQLLDMIKNKQDPKQAELRERKRKEWRKFQREINSQGMSIEYEQQIYNRNNIVAQLITI